MEDSPHKEDVQEAVRRIKESMTPVRFISAKDGTVFLQHERDSYTMPISDFDSLYSLINKLRHLNDKNWMDKHRVLQVLEFYYELHRDKTPFLTDEEEKEFLDSK